MLWLSISLSGSPTHSQEMTSEVRRGTYLPHCQRHSTFLSTTNHLHWLLSSSATSCDGKRFLQRWRNPTFLTPVECSTTLTVASGKRYFIHSLFHLSIYLKTQVTGIHLAAGFSSTSVVKGLVMAGADIHMCDMCALCGTPQLPLCCHYGAKVS